MAIRISKCNPTEYCKYPQEHNGDTCYPRYCVDEADGEHAVLSFTDWQQS